MERDSNACTALCAGFARQALSNPVRFNRAAPGSVNPAFAAQVLRYADEPEFLEGLGLAGPEAFHHVAREDCLLSDATTSAALGRQLAWQGLWAEGEAQEGLERGGKRVDKIWHAHKAMFDKVRPSPLRRIDACPLGCALQCYRRLRNACMLWPQPTLDSPRWINWLGTGCLTGAQDIADCHCCVQHCTGFVRCAHGGCGAGECPEAD